jgi:hypothetical protein
MSKKFSDLEEIKKAVFGAIYVSNGDPLFIETDSDAEAVASEIWAATEYGAGELDECFVPQEFAHARKVLGLEINVVRHIYHYSEGYITSYIVFSEDYDYEE